MAIPRNNETYKSKDYWDKRYTDENKYEWLETFDTLKEQFTTIVHPEHSILVIGCGNSSLSSDMFDAGYRNITSIDYSEVVIANLKQKHSTDRPEMKWVCADMRELVKTFPDKVDGDNGFDVVIDKAGMDALLTDEKSAWHPNLSTVEDCHSVLSGVSSVLKNAGHFIQITFSQPHFHRRYIEGPSIDFEPCFTKIEEVYSEDYKWRGTVKELKNEVKFSNFMWILQKEV